MTAKAQDATPDCLPSEEQILELARMARTDPSAVDELMALLLQLISTARLSNEENAELKNSVKLLMYRLALINERLYGRRTEKIDPNQLLLFLDTIVAETLPPAAEEIQPELPEKARPRGHGRDVFPAHLPRTEIKIDPDASELVCEECGKACCRIREEVTERGHFIPGYWEVKRYVRGVWACKDGCGSVRTASLPPTLVGKGRFEPSVAVHSGVAKFGDHQPLERQSDAHARLGVHAAPTSLGDGVTQLAKLHAPTVKQMEDEVLSESYLHVDETPIVAIIESAIAPAKARAANPLKKKFRIQARMWTYSTLERKMFYRFTRDRSRDGPGGPAEVLEKFCGCVIGDEYPGFDKICSRTGMTKAACWAHSRRKFNDAFKQGCRMAAIVIAMMARLFRIESAVRTRCARDPTFDAERHLAVRQRRSKRQVEKIEAYVRSIKSDALPRSALGIAIGYLLNNLENLKTFLSDPLIPLDNNAAERALRCVAVGRKNYLFVGSLAAGGTAAVLYSLIESCKALGINPYAYLMDTTQTLLANPDTVRASLTPWAWAEAEARRIEAEVADASPSE